MEGSLNRKVGTGLNNRKTTQEEDEEILLTAVSNRGQSAKNVSRELKLDIWKTTVYNHLKEYGLNRMVKVEKEKLNQSHIRGRLNFVHNYINLDEDWEKFVFIGLYLINSIYKIFKNVSSVLIKMN